MKPHTTDPEMLARADLVVETGVGLFLTSAPWKNLSYYPIQHVRHKAGKKEERPTAQLHFQRFPPA